MSEKIQSDSAKMLSKLVRGNVIYAEEHSTEFEQLKLKQTPIVTLLSCCDSRVPQNLFNIDGLNEIFTVRNIGNQFENSEGSVKYPVMHLHTPLLIVLGHTGCGAIKASLSDYRKEDSAIQKEVIGLVNSIRLADQTRDLSNVDNEDQKLAIYSQVNVDHQISNILAECNFEAKIKNGELCVIGMVFDIHGVYGGKSASAYVTNINGITDINQMRNNEVAAEIGLDLSELRFKRL